MNALAEISIHQRSAGVASAAFTRAGDRTRISDLRQEGSAKAIVLQDQANNAAEVVFLNTSGGLTGGDRLSYALQLGPGIEMTATTQTAERVYRSLGSHAQIDVMLDVAAGAHLDWIPQETILFDRAAACRRTQIHLARDATCLMVETLVLGRAAMGEVLHELAFRDMREITRDGQPVHLEAVMFDPARLRTGAAGLDGARVIATIVLVAPNAADKLGVIRDVLDCPQTQAGASALEGRLVIRLMAADAWPLRMQLCRILGVLREKPMPRVWQM